MKISVSERACAFALLLLFSSPLGAQTIDDSTKNAARELAAQAASAYEKGDFEQSQDLYRRAYALVPAPTLAVREARALEKLGRLVEAVEAYVRAMRTNLNEESPDAYRKAVQEASDELAKLRPRVPKLKIVVAGVDKSSLEVRLDGKRIKNALVGVHQPVDPGKHQITVIGPGKSGKASVSIAEGENKDVAVELADDPNAVVTPREENPAPNTEPVTRDPEVDTSSGFPHATLGWVSLGLGAAGVGVGVATGLMAANKHASAEESCPDQRCAEGSPGADDLDSFRTLRTVSTIGYAVGIVGIGAGVALLLTAPAKESTAHVSPWIGAGSAGVHGRF